MDKLLFIGSNPIPGKQKYSSANLGQISWYALAIVLLSVQSDL